MQYSVERSIVIDAAMASVVPHLADFNQWSAWSPWAVLEPGHHNSVHGDAGELGSRMEWNGQVIGAGKMSLVNKKLSPNSTELHYDLEFTAPWKSRAKSGFTVSESGDKANVTWRLDAEMPFYLFFMVGMMKSMIGMDYDRGLGMLKSVVETGEVDAETEGKGIVDMVGFDYVGVSRTSSIADMPGHMQADFQALMQACAKVGCEPAHVVSIYNKVRLSKQLFSYTSAIAGSGVDGIAADLGLASGVVKSQKMLEIKHRGSYQFIGNAWSMGHLTLRANKLKANGAPFEYYHNDPNDTPESELLTSVYFPIKA